jgi:hypothetical protein
VAVLAAVGAFATPDAVRFSRPLLAWGAANGTATHLSTLALALVVGTRTDQASIVLLGGYLFVLVARV